MNGASISMDSSTFRGLFSAQLSSSGVPTHLWEALRRKVLQVPTVRNQLFSRHPLNYHVKLNDYQNPN